MDHQQSHGSRLSQPPCCPGLPSALRPLPSALFPLPSGPPVAVMKLAALPSMVPWRRRAK